MKAIFSIIMTLFLTFFFVSIYGEYNPDLTFYPCLAPDSPKEAPFEDLTAEMVFPDLLSLKPSIPSVADFTDSIPIEAQCLVPISPREADFIDVVPDDTLNMVEDLIPVVPRETSFDDSF